MAASILSNSRNIRTASSSQASGILIFKKVNRNGYKKDKLK